MKKTGSSSSPTPPAWRDLIFGLDAFISYRRSDGRGYAHALRMTLERAGWRVWHDDSELTHGTRLTPTIFRALRKSRMLIVLVTPESVLSDWMPKELDAFAQARPEHPIFAIDFGGTAANEFWRAKLDVEPWRAPSSALESSDPGDKLLAALDAARKSRLRARLGRWTIGAAAMACALLLAVAVDRMLAAVNEKNLGNQRLGQSTVLALADASRSASGDLAKLLAVQAHLFNERHRGRARASIDTALLSIYEAPYRIKSLGISGAELTARAFGRTNESLLALDGSDAPRVLRLRGREFVEDAATDSATTWAEFCFGPLSPLPSSAALDSWPEISPRGLSVAVGDETWTDVRWTSDGSTWIAVSSVGRVVAGITNSEAAPRVLRDSSGEHQLVRAALDTSGELAAVAWMTSEGEECVVELHDLREGAQTPKHLYRGSPFEFLSGLLIAHATRRVVVWGASAEAHGTVLVLDIGERWTPFTFGLEGEGAASAALADDGRTVAFGTHRWGIDEQVGQTGVTICDIENVFTLDPNYRACVFPFRLGTNSVTTLAFSPDGKRLAACSGGGLWMFAESWRDGWSNAFAAEHHSAEIRAAAWAPASLASVVRLATLDKDGHVLAWDLDTLAQKLRHERRGSAAALDFCSGVHAGSSDESWIFVGDVGVEYIERGQRERIEFKGIDLAHSLSGDARSVALALESREVLRIELATRRQRRSPPLESTAIAIAADQQAERVVVLTQDRSAMLLDLRVADAVQSFEIQTDARASSVAWQPHSTRFAIGAEDGSLHRFDLVDESVVALASTAFGQRALSTLRVGRDGRIACTDGESVWTLGADDDIPTEVSRSSRPAPTALALDTTSRFVAVGRSDGIVLVHDLVLGGDPARRTAGKTPVVALAFGRAGLELASATEWRGDENPGRMLIQLTLEGLVELTSRDVWRDLSIEEWTRFAPGAPLEPTFESRRIELNGR